MFRLTEEETDYMVSQNAIPSKQHLGGHYLLFIFEHLRQLEQTRQQQEDQANRKKIGFRQDD